MPLRSTRLDGPNATDEQGFGDVDLFARWTASAPSHDPAAFTLRLLGGVSVPTGKEPRGERVDENLRFGAGTTSLLAAVEATGTAGPAAIYGRAELRHPTGASDVGVRFGSTTTAAVGFSAPRRRKVGALVQAIWQHQGVDEEHGQDVENRGGTTAYLAAGARVRIGEKGAGSLLLQRQVYANVKGNQLVAPWGVVLAYSMFL